MRTRLVVMTAVLATAMPLLGNAARAHEHHRGHDRTGDDRRGSRYSFELTGAQVPGGGDPEGRAHALLSLHPDREVVCLQANWQGLAGEVTAIHLHKGPAGKSGPHHIEILNDESLDGQWNRVEFCVKVPGGQHHAQAEGHHGGDQGGHGDSSESGDRIGEISENPSGFYLNIHSTGFPNGAVRGQLASSPRRGQPA